MANAKHITPEGDLFHTWWKCCVPSPRQSALEHEAGATAASYFELTEVWTEKWLHCYRVCFRHETYSRNCLPLLPCRAHWWYFVWYYWWHDRCDLEFHSIYEFWWHCSSARAQSQKCYATSKKTCDLCWDIECGRRPSNARRRSSSVVVFLLVIIVVVVIIISAYTWLLYRSVQIWKSLSGVSICRKRCIW